MTTSITSIEVEAFKNFAERTVLHLDDLPAGLHFVRGVNAVNDRLGSNGAGKSTLFSDAVAWCLYGRTIGGLRTTDIASWLTDKKPRVKIGLRRGDAEHVVQRGPKASQLTIDGKTVGQDDVDALIGVGFAAFGQAVVWGQAQPLFFDLQPRDKMALLSDALDLERWERRATAASARATKLQATLTEITGEILGLEAAEEHAVAAMEDAKDAAARWGEEHVRRLTEMRTNVDDLTKRHAVLEKNRGEEDGALESAFLKLDAVRPAVQEAESTLRQAEDDFHAADRERIRLIDAEERVSAELASFSETGVCPTCGQKTSRARLDAHITTLEERAAALVDQIKIANTRIKSATKRVEEAQTRLDDDASEQSALDALSHKHEAQLRQLERDTAVAASRLAEASDALRRVEEEANPHRDAASRAKTRLREVRDDIKEARKEAERYTASVERAQFWAKGFRDIRLTIVDDTVDDLRETTAEVMDDLGLGDWAVDYTTERETKSGTVQRALTVTVRSPAAPEGVRWEAYSGGERQRLRLAGALALSEVLMASAGAGLDFRVFDEPTRGLSREGVRDLCEALAAYAEDTGVRIFYVDHQSEDGLAFASTVTVIGGEDGAHIA